MNKFSLKHILRNFWKNKTSSFINILGLSVGLASTIIVFLFIEFELNFDNFYQNKNQIYRITRTIEHASSIDVDGATSYPLGYSLRNDFPDIEFSSIYMLGKQDILIDNNLYREENILFIDSVFFNIFNFEWMLGSPELLIIPENIAITSSLAEKYFGKENPLGKTITFSPNRNFQVVGIIKDPPINSTLKFNMILSLDNINNDIIGWNYDSWGSTISGFECYAKIPDVVNLTSFELSMNEVIINKYLDESNQKNTYFSLQGLGEMHLDPNTQNIPNTYTTSKTSLYIYAFIGLLIITIAAINFINLSTAQGLKRSREVGVRKVLGASKSQLSLLFIKENAFISLLAIVIAVIIVEVALPYFNVFLGNNHDLSIYKSQYFIGFLIIVFLLVNFIIALYPTFVMSRFIPIKALKGNLKISKQNVFNLRNTLLVFQFVISITLIIATITIKKQISYINDKDLGFRIEQIMNFQLPEHDSLKISTLRQFLKTEPGIISYGFGIAPPSSSDNFTTTFNLAGEDKSITHYLNLKPVDVGYPDVFDIKLIAGEWFPERSRGDSIFKLVVNEKLYKMHGFKNPIDALNKRIPFGGNFGTICGVVKDFHTYSLHKDIDPLAFASIPQFFSSMFVRIDENRFQETMAKIETKMSELYPNYYIEFGSVKDGLSEMYVEEDNAATIITILSGLAIFIASLGLFGIISLALVQRVKEIGIRKVLGASLQQIAVTFASLYVKLIIIASFIAIPIGWYFMTRWLEGFSYRIDIEFWIYILATFIALSIALTTILFQVVKTGRMNSVESLKYE